jgi:hypothetical protein
MAKKRIRTGYREGVESGALARASDPAQGSMNSQSIFTNWIVFMSKTFLYKKTRAFSACRWVEAATFQRVAR